MTSDTQYKLRPVDRWRRLAVLGMLGLGALLVCGRAFQLQVLEREFLTKQGAKRQSVAAQVARNPATAIEVVDVPPGSAIIPSTEGPNP